MLQPTEVVKEPKRRTRKEVREEILAAFELPIEERKTPATYQLSLMLASIIVVALPLVYLAIVIACGWGVYWYAVHAGSLLADVDSKRAYVLLRFGPLVVGAVVFFFLLKPLLAGRPKSAKPYSLDPEAEPFFFEFVRQLGQRLNAPMPRRIDVDLRVNASAGFASGLRGLIDGKYALTIGLPLASTMQLRDLSAVLAHEFGHLSQGAGLRFYYLIQTVIGWLARVVYQRDAWDLRLESASKGGWWWVMLVLSVARGCIWLSRRILFVLLKIGSATSSLMSRQMEFDADQNAIRLCGSKSFARSMELLPQIDAVNEWAAELNEMAYREGRLADDLPLLVQKGLGEMAQDVREKVVSDAMQTTVDMYASHPPTGERVARAEELDLPGILTVAGPASVLFQDYPSLCRDVTASFYAEMLGADYDPDRIVPSAEIHSRGEERELNAKRIEEYFLGVGIGPGTLAAVDVQPSAPERPKHALERLKNLRHEFAALAEEWGESWDPKLQDRLIRASAANDLLTRKLVVQDQEGAPATKGAAKMAIKTAQAELERDLAQRTEIGSVLRNRIALGLDLLCLPEVRERVEGADELAERAQRSLQCLSSIQEVSRAMVDLARQLAVIEATLPQLESQEGEALGRLINSQSRLLNAYLGEVRKKAGELPFPDPNGDGEERLLSDYLIAHMPTEERDLAQVGTAAQLALQAWGMLMNDLFGDVASAGLAVEKGLQLPSQVQVRR